MFEMKKKGDDHHIRYTFIPLPDNRCELQYLVWVEGRVISDRFSNENIIRILTKLKQVAESQ